MCGITGIVAPDGRETIVEMTRALSHRGPDEEGFYRDDRIALGQRRLSIVDLNGGRQPISNESDTLQLICNGEIYNSPQLRQDLIRAGHTFKTATDVEVILHLYEERGDETVRALEGMFAFALWDGRRRRLLLARDRTGKKPLFYHHGRRAFAFASPARIMQAAPSALAQQS